MLWLSQNVAPLHENSGVTFLRLLGTDPSAFESAFDRFRVTRGERLPVGRRGLMLSERVQETHFKHPVAHTFDQIERITRDDRNAITQDPNAADLKARLLSLTTKLGDDLGEHRSKVESSLAQALGVATDESLSFLLDVSPSRFETQRALFYSIVAPAIRLYRIDAGDQITLRAFTRRGYLESINLKVFGVFRFDGLEASELAGTNSLIDLVSLRSLYGADDTETSKELEAIRRDMGLEAVSAESAVDDLFRGAESDVHAELTGAPTDWSQERETLEISRDARSYDAKELSRGLVLNVAVILEDPKLLTQTLSSIENRISRSNLELVAVGWQEASGMMGQFVAIVRAALATSLLIVFMVAIAV
ncbi:MAG: hypothetical protein AAFY60_20360, partial [Myxococcota bacterium]